MKMQTHKDNTATFGQDRDNQYYSKQASIKAGSYASLPKNLKARLNLPIRAQTTGHGIQGTQGKPRSKSPIQQSDQSEIYQSMRSDIYGTRSTSRGKLVKKKTSPGTPGSPPSQVYKNYSKCHKYHSDLDHNYLFDQKLHNQTLHGAKDRITSKALKDCSPDGGYFNRAQSPDLTKSRMDYINLNKSNHETKRYLDEFYNADLEKKLKSSRGVISGVVDSQFSVGSPSKLKLYNDELSQIKNDEFKEKLSRSQLNTSPDRIYVDENNTKLTINLSYVGENPSDRFLEALESVMTILDPVFDRCTLNEKIEKFLEITDDHRRTVRLGSLVALYSICCKYDIEDEYKLHVIEKVTGLIQNYEIQEELFLVACLEILTLYAPNELLLQNLNLICMFLTDFNYPMLQKAAFNCIMCMEYEGIKVSNTDLIFLDFS
jgi:hypothetical protein